MHVFTLDHEADFEGWRRGARTALQQGLATQDIRFAVKGDSGALFDAQAHTIHEEPDSLFASEAPLSEQQIRVPKDFPQLAQRAICHSDPERFLLLYEILSRLQIKRTLLRDRADPQVHRLNVLAKEVGRDKHKMTAFVRFRLVEGSEPEHYVSWFEPSHYSLDYTAPFFMRRFTGMHWSIFTPYRSAHWNGKTLSFGKGASKHDVPEDDHLEDYWRTYYAHIFNPARVKLKAMQAEMPKKYWKNLPEAEMISRLTKHSEARTKVMMEQAPILPALREPETSTPARQETAAPSIDALTDQLRSCARCQLCHGATQVVPGAGMADARIMLVGEQPGDQEDLAGKPFVGPAGQLLNDAIAEAGLDREQLYVTNAVKHFKYTMRGKRRIHQRPDTAEIDACRWWLGQELALVKPRTVVALGATAHRGLTGKATTIGKARLEPLELAAGAKLQTTYHPSAILRVPNEDLRRDIFAKLVEDLVSASALSA